MLQDVREMRKNQEAAQKKVAPGVGLEPTTKRLTAACSTN